MMRSLLLAVALLFGALIIGLAVTGQLEPLFEHLARFLPAPAPVLTLVPVDYDPFDPCYLTGPHDLCI